MTHQKKKTDCSAQDIANALVNVALELPFEVRGEVAHAVRFLTEQSEELRFERERVADLQERYCALAGAPALVEFDRPGALNLAQRILQQLLQRADHSFATTDPEMLVVSAQEITECVVRALRARHEAHTPSSVSADSRIAV